MPRTRKTPTGAPAQPVQAIPGQEYGRGVQQEAMQRAMPTPSVPSTQAPERPITQPQPQVADQQVTQAPTRQPVDPAQIAQLLRGVGGLLQRPDDRPDVSFAKTLENPEAAFRAGVMPTVNRTGEIMRDLSRRTGDSTFADLAAKAGL